MSDIRHHFHFLMIRAMKINSKCFQHLLYYFILVSSLPSCIFPSLYISPSVYLQSLSLALSCALCLSLILVSLFIFLLYLILKYCILYYCCEFESNTKCRLPYKIFPEYSIGQEIFSEAKKRFWYHSCHLIFK